MKKKTDSLSVILVPSLLINMSAPHTQLVVFSGWLTSFLLFSCFSVLWQLFCVFCHNWKRLKRFPRVLHTSTADVLSIHQTSVITFECFNFFSNRPKTILNLNTPVFFYLLCSFLFTFSIPTAIGSLPAVIISICPQSSNCSQSEIRISKRNETAAATFAMEVGLVKDESKLLV